MGERPASDSKKTSLQPRVGCVVLLLDRPERCGLRTLATAKATESPRGREITEEQPLLTT